MNQSQIPMCLLIKVGFLIRDRFSLGCIPSVPFVHLLEDSGSSFKHSALNTFTVRIMCSAPLSYSRCNGLRYREEWEWRKLSLKKGGTHSAWPAPVFTRALCPECVQKEDRLFRVPDSSGRSKSLSLELSTEFITVWIRQRPK